ncbi:HNH endonuclease signature motif containing protein [Rhizohabitans arisaemae]|uniref:HNH endonuclease signature motif containing protein n=1 Tax=Rhizohabitans arisaemae TaxID=2720610 RepID=UPI0024B26A25|nr:HNH endonuclease signature motif containing protein [Rhizohabitans arisaemae]
MDSGSETVSVDPATATPQQVLEATLRLAAACARLPVPGSGAACMERAALLGDVADAVEVALAPLVERIDSCGEAKTHGFTGTGAWLATGLGTRTAVAADRLALARTLRRLPEVAERFEGHRLPAGYAAAICRAVRHLDDADTAAAEGILLRLAEAGGTVEQVRKAGERIVETVRGDSPDGDTRRGYADSWLEVNDSPDGGAWVNGWLDPELKQLLQSKLDPLTSRTASAGAGTRGGRNAAALRTFLTRDGRGQEAVVVITLRDAHATGAPDVVVPSGSLLPPPGHPPVLPGGIAFLPAGPAGPGGAVPSSGTAASADGSAGAGTVRPLGEPVRLPGWSGHSATSTSDAEEAAAHGAENGSGAETRAPAGLGTGAGAGVAGIRARPGVLPGPEPPAYPLNGCGDQVGGGLTLEPGPVPDAESVSGATSGTGFPVGPAGVAGIGAGAGSGNEGRWRIAAARLADGTPVSVAQARRIALNHGVSPLLLSGEGRPLYLGERVRFASAAQRRVLAVRYATCAVDECDVPSRACEVDHIEGWEFGGRTDIDNLACVCGFHNRHKADHPGAYEIVRRRDGTVVYRILRPPWMRKHAA